ncbi:MAG: hypothetical protein WCR42_13635 [bacterium]
MKKLLILIILAVLATACADPVSPTTSDLYGIWEGREILEKANPDSTYLYCEFDGTNETVTGQAIFQANRFLLQTPDFTNLRYYRSGQITGKFETPNLTFNFKNDQNIVYSFTGVVNDSLTGINGIMKIHDIKYTNLKDTTINCSIKIRKQKT